MRSLSAFSSPFSFIMHFSPSGIVALHLCYLTPSYRHYSCNCSITSNLLFFPKLFFFFFFFSKLSVSVSTPCLSCLFSFCSDRVVFVLHTSPPQFGLCLYYCFCWRWCAH